MGGTSLGNIGEYATGVLNAAASSKGWKGGASRWTPPTEAVPYYTIEFSQEAFSQPEKLWDAVGKVYETALQKGESNAEYETLIQRADPEAKYEEAYQRQIQNFVDRVSFRKPVEGMPDTPSDNSQIELVAALHGAFRLREEDLPPVDDYMAQTNKVKIGAAEDGTLMLVIAPEHLQDVKTLHHVRDYLATGRTADRWRHYIPPRASSGRDDSGPGF